MSSTFTAYIRSLGPGGEPPSSGSFGDLLGTLRGALVHEMKRRSVWSSPPAFLGVYGGNRWADSDLLEELLLGCYHYIFLGRLAALKRQLEIRSNLDGLIFLNIRHFLHEAQRRHDPLGIRLFEITHRAVELLKASGKLNILDGDPKIRNATVLAFGAWRDAQEAEGVDLTGAINAWCDELLPDLITSWGKEELAERLAARIASLTDSGVSVFRFRDLMAPLKAEVRARWRALLTDGEFATDTQEPHSELTQLVLPESDFEQTQSFSELLSCVSDRLEATEERAKTRDYLRRLWQCLWLWAAEKEASKTGGDSASTDEDLVAEAAAQLATAGRQPSDKRLAELLGIPRARISGLKQTLGQMLQSCRGSTSAPASDPTPRADLGKRREKLRRKTGEVAASAAVTLKILGDKPPQPGEILLLATQPTVPAEWLVVEQDVPDRRCWLVPVDQAPFIGREDLSIRRTDGETARVRCRAGAWVKTARLTDARRAGELAPEELQRIHQFRQRMANDEIDSSAGFWHSDPNPEYREWILELQVAAAELGDVGPKEGGAEVVPFKPRGHRATPGPWRALAAALAAVALGLSLWTVSLRRQVDRGSQPFLVARSATEVVRFGAQRELEVQVSRTAKHLGFRVPLTRYADYDAVRLRWLDATRDEELWSSEWHSGESELFLVMPRERLTAETYQLQLEGRRADGTVVMIDDYEVEVEILD